MRVEMTNPATEQAAIDADLQLKAAEAEYDSLRVKLESDLMTQKAGAATVTQDYSQAKLQAETDKELYNLGVISGLTYKASKGKADELTTRNGLEEQRLTIAQKAILAQLRQQEAKVDQMRTLAKLRAKQLNDLKVRPGIDGMLVDMPLQVGLNNGGDLDEHGTELTGFLADSHEAKRRRRQKTRAIESPV